MLRKEAMYGVGLYLVLILTGWIYFSGINDVFYFDDYSNLSALNHSGQVDDWNSAREFIFGNAAGPTGRPVAMASFLLDDNAWPSLAGQFKKNNILFHLVTGCLLFWVSLSLCKLRSEPRAAASMALIVTAFWLMNPFLVSTVLYPVQRMAQLSSLFCLLGMLFYIKGRVCFSHGKVIQATLHALCVGGAYILALFSKENGAILPLLLLVTELTFLKRLPWNFNWIRLLALSTLGLGCVLIISFLLYKASDNGWFSQYPGRDFTPYQRVITEPYLILYYLKELALPSLYTPGLYYDDLNAFQSIFEWKAFGAIIIVLALLIVSVFLWSKGLTAGFAFLFFFSAHLIESTTLNLELVFDHRNYLPSLFLGFVWLSVADWLRNHRVTRNCIIVIPLFAFSGITAARVDLWRQDVLFGAYLAEKSPHSVRSHIELNNALLFHGYKELARSKLKTAIDLNPDNAYLRMHAVLVDCLLSEKDQRNLDGLINVARANAFDGRDRLAMDKLWQYMRQERCGFIDARYFSEVLMAFKHGGEAGRYEGEISERLLRIYSDRFYVLYPEFSPSKVKPLTEIINSDNPEYIMSTAAYLASVNRFDEALMLANASLELIKKGVLKTSKKDPEKFKRDIEEFKEIVHQDKNASK